MSLLNELSDDDKRRIKQMLAGGSSINHISSALGISPVIIALVLSNESTNQPDATKLQVIIPQLHEKGKRQGDVLLGFSETDEPIYWNPMKSPNPHLMAVGESGFGKTYGIIGITCELSKIGMPTVIIDYTRSYEKENFPSKIKQSNKLHEITLGENGISLNPLEIRKSDIKGPLSVAGRIAGTINRIYRIGVRQHAVLQETIIAVYRQRGIYQDCPHTWNQEAPPHLSDVFLELRRIAEDEEHPDRSIAENTHAHLYSFFSFNTFNPNGAKFKWEDALDPGKITVLQLNGLEGNTQKVITEFLLWDIFSFACSKGPQPLNYFLVLDEAHNLKFDQDTPVDKIIREARKFGLAALLASQQPKDFSGSVFANTGTKISYQVVQDTKFFKQMSSKAKMNVKDIETVLTTLPRGRAFIITENEGQVCRIASHSERGFE